MGATAKRTVVYRENGILRRVCKLIIGHDGSYYVTAPFHASRKAFLMKMTVNYDSATAVERSIDEAIDIAALDEGRLKLSHHPDGFVQYSGDGVLSGRDETGQIRGMGVMSSPLNNIFRGPAFALAVQGIEQLDVVDKIDSEAILFDLDAMPTFPEANGVVLEGYYFPPLCRRFVRRDRDGTFVINIQHPCSANLELIVLLAGEQCKYPGLIGLEAYRRVMTFPEPGFTLNGPGGGMRLNEHGHRVADCLFCMYPRDPEFAVRRSLNFPHPISQSSDTETIDGSS
ncbi:MAG: hypothetical protein WD648_09615 [Planctomycetaceae bacterium]